LESANSWLHRSGSVPKPSQILGHAQKTITIAKEIPRSPLSDENVVLLVSRKLLEKLDGVGFGLFIL
jgi:hypothetical protein